MTDTLGTFLPDYKIIKNLVYRIDYSPKNKSNEFQFVRLSLYHGRDPQLRNKVIRCEQLEGGE